MLPLVIRQWNQATSGHESVAGGYQSGMRITGLLVIIHCFWLWELSGDQITTGSNNTCIGHDVASHDTNLTTGYQNTIIGGRSNTGNTAVS